MASDFLKLNHEERRQIYDAASQRTGLAPQVLEKDVWVCWVLNALFAMSDGPRLAFKGGTSLSKVYALIDRFSEDVDVSYDYRDLGVSLPEDLSDASNKTRDEVGQQLQDAVRKHIRTRVEPSLRKILEQEFEGAELTVGPDGESLAIIYPVATAAPGYMPQRVLVEFGGRNPTEPGEKRTVTTYMAKDYPDLAFPSATVEVLKAERTFWEKATLIHAEVNKARDISNSERISRHWYDLHQLAQSFVGQSAMADRKLLEKVVVHKKTFYRSASAKYDECLTGNLRLVPSGQLRVSLEQDFRRMKDAGMFLSDPPDFDEILKALEGLQEQINNQGGER